MQQNKKEVAGQLYMDLDGCTIGPVEADDRRNVFHVRNKNYSKATLVTFC